MTFRFHLLSKNQSYQPHLDGCSSQQDGVAGYYLRHVGQSQRMWLTGADPAAVHNISGKYLWRYIPLFVIELGSAGR